MFNNAVAFYQISQLFKLSRLSELALRFIERCFSIVVESQKFLEVDFLSLKKILVSSELHIDSKLKVFNASEHWLCHKVTERYNYPTAIWSKVRLSLLPVPVLKNYFI